MRFGYQAPSYGYPNFVSQSNYQSYPSRLLILFYMNL
jgi:hypothetical protein